MLLLCVSTRVAPLNGVAMFALILVTGPAVVDGMNLLIAIAGAHRFVCWCHVAVFSATP